MEKNTKDEKYLPQYITDRIVKDLIDQLLKQPDEFETKKRFDPYSLTSGNRFSESPHFIHGQKKLTEPTELKKAYKEPIKLKPTYKEPAELKHAYKSMIEFKGADRNPKTVFLTTKAEMMKFIPGDVSFLGIYDSQDEFTKLNIEGINADFYIGTEDIKRLIDTYLTEYSYVDHQNGFTILACAKIDCRILAPYLYRIYKK